jgi:hypothetical protein
MSEQGTAKPPDKPDAEPAKGTATIRCELCGKHVGLVRTCQRCGRKACPECGGATMCVDCLIQGAR